jgi:hypothetical protein
MELRNTGASGLPAGVLVWNGSLHPFVALRPDAGATFGPGGGTRATRGAQGLAVVRTPLDAQSILWPLDLGRVQHAPAQSQAWLLMRIGASGQG